MRRTVFLLVPAVCALLTLPARDLAAQGTSPCAKAGVAFVSSNQILASIPAYVAADSLVKKDVAAYQVELQKLKGSLDSASQVYAEKSTLLSATQKAAEMKKLQAQNDALNARVAELDGKVTARRNELLQPIELRVTDVLDGLRAELNCAMIFDVSNGAGIASADKSLDLTQRIIDRLKAADAAKTVKPAGGGIKPPGGGGIEPDAAAVHP